MNRDIARRERRLKKTRAKIKTQHKARLTVHKSLRHIYAQIFTPDGSKVLAFASTVEKEIASQLTKFSVNKTTAAIVGGYIAERALKAGINNVAFDRSGYKYHGCVKALAEAAREKGLIF